MVAVAETTREEAVTVVDVEAIREASPMKTSMTKDSPSKRTKRGLTTTEATIEAVVDTEETTVEVVVEVPVAVTAVLIQPNLRGPLPHKLLLNPPPPNNERVTQFEEQVRHQIDMKSEPERIRSRK